MYNKLKICLFLIFIFSLFIFACNKKDTLELQQEKENQVKKIDGYMKEDEEETLDYAQLYQENLEKRKSEKQKEINFGKYNEKNDDNKVDLKWIIISEDSKEKKVLITTKYSIDYMPFNKDGEACTWETSSIREWLNNDFYNSFSDEEKEKIIKTHLDNTTIKNMRIEGGNATDDYIFLASVDEIEKYKVEDLIYSANVLNKIKNETEYNGYKEWWLRNNATIKNNKMYYDSKLAYEYDSSDLKEDLLVRGVNYDGANAFSSKKAIRPFMWIKYEDLDVDDSQEKVQENIKINKSDSSEKLKIGKNMNHIKLGSYQDEDIDWEVLRIEGDKALLVSRYVIDTLPYNENGEACTWETSSIRKWLNEDFYNNSFSVIEKNYIANIQLTNIDNESTATNGGNNTIDKIFLLSYEDIKEYLQKSYNRFDDYLKYKRTYPTSYVLEKNDWSGTKDNIKWWLRMPGKDQKKAAYTYFEKDNLLYEMNGRNVDDKSIGVRPAMCVCFDENIEDIENKEKENAIAIDDNTTKISIGKYFIEDENNKVGLTWRILEKDEINKKALVVSDVIIDRGNFSDDVDNGSWEYSRVRNWLNNDFYNEVFDSREKETIVESKISTRNQNKDNKNRYVKDKIFLLSREDLFFYFNDIGSRAAKGSKYAKSKGLDAKHEKDEGIGLASGGYSPYWLRSSAKGDKNVDLVNTRGQLTDTYTYKNINLNYGDIGIRPAMWVNYKIGEVKLESQARGKINEIIKDLFDKNIDIDSVAITDKFKNNIESDPFKAYGLYNDEFHKYRTSNYNKKKNTIVVGEYKNDEKGSYHHPYYKGMGLELREIHYSFKLDSNGYLDELTPIYTDTYYSEDFSIAKNGILFNQNNYISIIESLCRGEYYNNKSKDDAEEEKFKIFYHDFDQYALSEKYRKGHNLDDSILDKERFKELADYIGTGEEYQGEKHYVSNMEYDPAKTKEEYFNDKMLPIAFNFDTERIYYNIYFTYTDDYMLDTIKVEEVKKKNIKKGDYMYDEELGESW